MTNNQFNLKLPGIDIQDGMKKWDAFEEYTYILKLLATKYCVREPEKFGKSN